MRWTLPAIYAHHDILPVIRDNDYWPNELKYDGRQDGGTAHYMKQMCQKRLTWENGRKRETKFTLLALPTLGVQVPGLHEWLRAQFRYHKVDLDMLQKSSDIATWEALFQREYPAPAPRPSGRSARAGRMPRAISRLSRGVWRRRCHVPS